MSRVAARLCQERAAAEGLGSKRNAVKYLNQDYEALKQRCLQAGTLFKDEEFPACPSALGYRDLGPYSFKTQGIIWKRPTILIYSPSNVQYHGPKCIGDPRSSRLNGSYEALTGGSTMEGFEDFTGGISESYELRRAPSNLYQIIQKALRAGSLLGCSIDITNTAEIEAITSLKLVKGHAYSVTGAEEVYYRGRPEKLVRLRNPWGEVEWTGAWSDNAPEWNYVDPKQRQALDKQVDDGEFWMAFSDFQRQFTRLEICSLTPDTLTSNEVNKWDLTLFNGQWRRGSTAGGCQNYQATYWTNPQFKIRLDEPDDDHEGSLNEPCCTILVGLMQKNRRRQKKMGEALLSIGYSLYRLENNTDIHANRAFFARNQPAARSDPYVNLREVSSRMKLPRGEYLIVPSTFEPYKNGEFCLRVFSEKQAKTQMIGDVVAAKPYEPHVDNKDIDDEFKNLFQKLSGEAIYKKVDSDYSGTIDAHEMRNALREAGFTLSNEVQHSIVTRYACSKLTIDFDGFVACMIRLETLFKVFHLLNKDKSGVIQLSLAEPIACSSCAQCSQELEVRSSEADDELLGTSGMGTAPRTDRGFSKHSGTMRLGSVFQEEEQGWKTIGK
ncbi:hypothetical protein llap_9190 [Limosa lapponica baueri]|uniref:Calpain-8 n=1 Tax=Limosa lapponica baueri TaxID=1758121 RepID=A0A2I0U339_LIMLA|nr:hypothetical protein llap_9190 [Limosa lapponica baueri]